MPVGVIVNTASIALGGIAGVFLGKKMPPKLKKISSLFQGYVHWEWELAPLY